MNEDLDEVELHKGVTELDDDDDEMDVVGAFGQFSDVSCASRCVALGPNFIKEWTERATTPGKQKRRSCIVIGVLLVVLLVIAAIIAIATTMVVVYELERGGNTQPYNSEEWKGGYKRLQVQRHGVAHKYKVALHLCFGRYMKEIKHCPEYMITSAMQYAVNTAVANAQGCGFKGDLFVEPMLHDHYGGDYGHVTEYLNAATKIPDEYELVQLVGHDPGMHRLISWFTGLPNDKEAVTWADVESTKDPAKYNHHNKHHPENKGNNKKRSLEEVSRLTPMGTLAEILLPIDSWDQIWSTKGKGEILWIGEPPKAWGDPSPGVCPHGDKSPTGSEPIIDPPLFNIINTRNISIHMPTQTK